MGGSLYTVQFFVRVFQSLFTSHPNHRIYSCKHQAWQNIRIESTLQLWNSYHWDFPWLPLAYGSKNTKIQAGHKEQYMRMKLRYLWFCSQENTRVYCVALCFNSPQICFVAASGTYREKSTGCFCVTVLVRWLYYPSITQYMKLLFSYSIYNTVPHL